MKERDVIEVLRRRLARSAAQRNAAFDADAELVELDGRLLAVTVDEFSAEDHLPADDPALLGWNLVTATASDLLAVGAQPRFLLNSLVTAPWMDASYLDALSRGLQEALDASGAFMVGGDVGAGDAWHFTGVGWGTFADEAAIRSRRVRAERGVVLVTGDLGDGNLAAALADGPAPRFEVRRREAEALGRHRDVAAIDTSDGLGAALETICRQNVDLRVVIDVEDVPYAPGVLAGAAATGLPPLAFLFGSAGEYELLAFVPDDGHEDLVRIGFQRIGAFERTSEAGLFVGRAGPAVPVPPMPDPREAADLETYRDRLIATVQSLSVSMGAAR